MKLLVFAHTPPPHHGQSYMVKLLLDGFGGDRRKNRRLEMGDGSSEVGDRSSEMGNRGSEVGDRKSGIECYHVNCRYSETLEDIGSFRLGKMWLVLRYCLEVIWCRFRYGVHVFYYVPAPGKRAALYRDWVVMLLCRPFFREMIHHWHAAGLGDWLIREGTWFERWLTQRLLGRPALGIALAIPSMRDALWFRSRDVRIVPDGIGDPCPDFASAVLPVRRRRLEARGDWQRRPATVDGAQESPGGSDAGTFQVLYLAHCTRDKGLFDALDGVALANARLRGERSGMRCRLTVAGLFPRGDDEAEFRARIAHPDLAGAVEYVGFVEGERKSALLRSSDCLCFPTYYHAETFGLVVVEAMAAGLCIVTTRWRAIPDLLPAEYPGFVPVRDPGAVAQALIESFTRDDTILRDLFVAHFTEEAHLASLAGALRAVGGDGVTGDGWSDGVMEWWSGGVVECRDGKWEMGRWGDGEMGGSEGLGS